MSNAHTATLLALLDIKTVITDLWWPASVSYSAVKYTKRYYFNVSRLFLEIPPKILPPWKKAGRSPRKHVATRFVYNIYRLSYISNLIILFIIFIGVRLAAGYFVYNIYRRSVSTLYVYINILRYHPPLWPPSRVTSCPLVTEYPPPRNTTPQSSRVRTLLVILLNMLRVTLLPSL